MQRCSCGAGGAAVNALCEHEGRLRPLLVQVLGWMQPFLTDQFIRLAFHPDTFRTQPELIELERGRSMQNPPYMFRAFHLQVANPFGPPPACTSVPACMCGTVTGATI